MTWIPGFCSEDADGEGVLISTTAAPGNLIHTATSASGSLDQVRLYASNTHAGDVLVTVQWGNKNHSIVIPPRQPYVLIVPGDRIKNGKTIRVFANVANVVIVKSAKDTYSP